MGIYSLAVVTGLALLTNSRNETRAEVRRKLERLEKLVR